AAQGDQNDLSDKPSTKPGQLHRAPSLHRHYPASSVVRTHPPSEAADAGPQGFVVGFGSWPFPRRQTSLVAHCPCSVRSATITPVGPPVAYLARFPGGVGLPRYSGGSAPTLALSRSHDVLWVAIDSASK